MVVKVTRYLSFTGVLSIHYYYIGLEDQVNGCVDNEVLTNTVTLLLRDLNSINRHMSFENNNNKKEEETV